LFVKIRKWNLVFTRLLRKGRIEKIRM